MFVYGFRIADLPFALATTEFADFNPERRSSTHQCTLPSAFLEHIAKNYSKLERPCSWPTALSYSSLVKFFHKKVPKDFFKFYSEIKILTVSKRIGRFSLTRLLADHGGIEQLILTDDCLGQEFFNRLEVISSLDFLNLIRYNKKIDFSFVSKLENLRTLGYQSDTGLLTSEGLESLEDYKYFETFYFTAARFTLEELIHNPTIRTKTFHISKVTELYTLKSNNKKIYEGEDIREAIAAINPALARVLVSPDIANS